ncbi:hypothetical protein FRB90_002152 [Tulasnella sp. 427]|nr:hypothetical protein FRB90_002152 [Tulasnella sp. 427]
MSSSSGTSSPRYTSQATPYYPSPLSSPSTVVQPMMSTSTLQSTLSTSSTVADSAGKSKRASFLRALGLKTAGTSSALALLPEDSEPEAGSSRREETKQEKKDRKRREQEAKMTPEERRLAQLMGRYGAGADASGFGGMSMDYSRKDKQKADGKK